MGVHAGVAGASAGGGELLDSVVDLFPDERLVVPYRPNHLLDVLDQSL